jgi:hypothetical protein
MMADKTGYITIVFKKKNLMADGHATASDEDDCPKSTAQITQGMLKQCEDRG